MARSNAAGIGIPDTAVAQFKVLLQHIDRVPAILEQAKKNGYGVTIFQVLRPIAKALDLPHAELEGIVYALENLRQLTENFGSPQEALDRVEAGIKDAELIRKLKANREKIFGSIVDFSAENPILVSFKSQRLVYNHERILRETEILTDVRPVFNTKGDEILEMIISHSLVITNHVLNRPERLHFEADAADIIDLRDACNRAILKANTLKQALRGSDQKWKVQVLREDDDVT